MITCYGIIALRGGRETLLVLHQKGFWGFPKGHRHEGEGEREAAEREFEEETGLHVVRFLDQPRFEEHYEVEGEPKTVYYYLAEVDGVVDVQEEEIQSCRWLSFDEAIALATYDGTKRLISSLADRFLFLWE